jgi:hypothetical protein
MFSFELPRVGDQGGPETFTFEELVEQTRVKSAFRFASLDEIEGALAGGMISGAVDTWDRFAAMLAEA